MEKLTLKEIAGYLPYGLEFIYNNDSNSDKNKWLLVSLGKRHNGNDFFAKAERSDYKNQINTTISLIKPLLYPLSMLTKTIVHNGVEIIPIDLLGGYVDWEDGIQVIEWWKIETLYEHHFDIHGLIERGLAIDKSKI